MCAYLRDTTLAAEILRSLWNDGKRDVDAVTPVESDTPPGPRTTGGRDAATVFAAQSGRVVFGIAIQSLLAWMLLPEGRGSFALCAAFAGFLSVLFTPGAREGA